MKKISKFFKQLFCKHDFETISKIPAWCGKGWFVYYQCCKKCGKVRWH